MTQPPAHAPTATALRPYDRLPRRRPTLLPVAPLSAPDLDAPELTLATLQSRATVVDDARHAPGDVLLTVRVTRDRVLLSDFLDWHQVLNRSIVVDQLPGEADARWEQRFDLERDAWDERTREHVRVPIDRWPPHLRAETEASWEVIFDLDRVPSHRPVQAVLREITDQDVVRAVRVIGRRSGRLGRNAEGR